ncbi:MAG: type II toxin-antitoxin system VapC family toxin [Gemmatimonadota bacterium]|nr:type II toxin-antitoxin system VapC family toxin [Gemmatimonadota bacterium]
MNEFLIDTNIYSHAMRAEPAVVSLLRRASRIAMSSISIGELLSGFKGRIREPKNRDELAEFLDSPRVEICAVSEDTAEFYAEILNGLRRVGTPIPTNDVWIAAQAMEHGLRLVSMDRHFASVQGLLLLSPRAPAPQGEQGDLDEHPAS